MTTLAKENHYKPSSSKKSVTTVEAHTETLTSQSGLNTNKAVDFIIRSFNLPLYTATEDTIYFDYTFLSHDT